MNSKSQNDGKTLDVRSGHPDREDSVSDGGVPQGHTAQFVGSHRVVFPGEPYNVQLPLMERVLRALDAKSHALIEAPTGVGKTVALLCASMQWLEDHTLKTKSKLAEALTVERSSSHMMMAQPSIKQDSESSKIDLWRFSYNSPGKRTGQTPVLESETVVMSARKKSSRLPPEVPEGDLQRSGKKLKTELGRVESAGDPGSLDGAQEVCAAQAEEPSALDSVFREKQTRIFYATRTHSQIAQVIDELQRTKYKPKTTILAARRHCCVHPVVSKSADVDRGCKNLLQKKGESCQYFVNTQRMKSEKSWPIKDIEDLGKICKKKKICPYFLARKRLPETELVLSPYNYLIQPSIRNSFELDLDSAGIIFDEGHNIDDVSRSVHIKLTDSEAASFETDLDAINAAGLLFQKKGQFYEMFNQSVTSACSTLECALNGLSKLLQEYLPEGGKAKTLKKVEYGKFEVVYEPSMAMKLLDAAGVGSVHLVAIKDALTLIDSLDQAKDDDFVTDGSPFNEPDVSVGMALIGQLINALDMMYKGPSEFTEAYRMCIKRLQHADQSTSRRSSFTGDHQIQLQLICLNAAVAFSQISQVCRSVILTSGTLSPMSSFASELGIEFKFILESSHVIKMEKQVWAGVCTVDPENLPITCTYNELQKTELLDSIGRAIFQWTEAVPDGVLVFMPSFRVLSLLIDRWMATGLFKRLNKLKKVFQEARGGSENFEDLMTSYYKTIDSGKGAIFLGVCRGKASEGINFTDAYARSVVIVGIPYPAIMDVKVKMKKDYNTKWSNRLGLMNGNAWYNQQAFRALNQGIGRCIRHKNDFGAILLLDSRFASQERISYVSRWVRSQAQEFQSFSQSIASVREFYIRNQDLQALVQPPAKKTRKKKTSNRMKGQTALDFVQEPSEGLVGFAELVDETLDKDISSFTDCLVRAGIFTDCNEEDLKEANQASKRSILDCLNQALKSVSHLEEYLDEWMHCIPTGIAVLFKLKGIRSKFTVDEEVLSRRQLSASQGVQECLEELKGLYMERMEPLPPDIEEVSISTE
eukprot:g6488.t1